MSSKTCRTIKARKEANDKIYTPKPVALTMIEMCELKEGDIVLDPSYGGGVFYNNFPNYVNKSFCEIEMDLDFFDYNERVDCIIGNPPYSLWDKWLEHTMKITNKFCYIFGNNNFTPARTKKLIDNGFGVTKFTICRVEWWFSTCFMVVFEKNKPSIISSLPRVYCDICNIASCLRGKYGNDMNKCTKL
jgi:hypothetical protein